MISTFLVVVTFLLSFYKSTNIEHCEDFIHSTNTLRFINNFSLEYLMYEPFNSMDFLAFPFYLLIDFDLYTLRLAQSFFIAFAVLFFYLFLKNHFNSRLKSFLSSLLLLTFPYFIIEKSAMEYPFLVFFVTLFLYLFQIAADKQENHKEIALLGLVVGLGIFRKLILAPIFLFYPLFWLLFNKKDFIEKFLTKKRALIFSALSLVGLFPFFLYSIFFSGSEHSLLNYLNLKLFEEGRIHNIPHNLIERFSQIEEIALTYTHHYFTYPIFFYLLILSVLYLLIRRNKVGLIFILTSLVYILLSTLELNCLIVAHLYILIPLFVVIISTAIFSFFEDLLGEKTGNILSVLVIGVLVGVNLFNISYYYRKNQQEVIQPKNPIRYEIGSFFRDDNVENIFLFTSDEIYTRWNVNIYFTSKGKNYFKAHDILKKNGRAYSEDGFVLEGIDELKNTFKNPKNAYLDVRFLDSGSPPAGGMSNEDRMFDFQYINNELKENNYQKKYILNRERETVYVIWVHDSNYSVIENIEKFKKEYNLHYQD